MSDNKSSGVGIPTVLVVVFVTLKLVDVIAWSWVWVLSPWWIPLTLVVAFAAVVGPFAGLVGLLDRRRAMREFASEDELLDGRTALEKEEEKP